MVDGVFVPGESCRLWCDPRKGSNKTFLRAIGDFVKQSHHKELVDVLWCLRGHSGGAFWSSLMQTEFPERIAAIWLRSGTAFGYWEKGEIKEARHSRSYLPDTRDVQPWREGKGR